MNSRLLLIVVAVLLISAVAQAYVEIPTSRRQGADTYLTNDSRDDGNAVFGTAGGIEIRDYPGTRQRIGYLRFDITGVEPDVGYDLTNYLDNAVLRVQNSSKGKTMRSKWIGVYGLANNDTDDAWDEATTCYNIAPGMDASAPLGYYAINWKLYPRLGEIWVIEQGASGTLTTCDSSPTPVVNDGYAGSLDLSSLLYADENGLVTLAMIFEFGDSKPDWWFTAKEGVDDPLTKIAPTLILPNAIPEPATIALLGLGGLALIRRKRW